MTIGIYVLSFFSLLSAVCLVIIGYLWQTNKILLSENITYQWLHGEKYKQTPLNDKQITKLWRREVELSCLEIEYDEFNGIVRAIEEEQNNIVELLAQPEPEPVAWVFPSDLKSFETQETTAVIYSVEMGRLTENSIPL